MLTKTTSDGYTYYRNPEGEFHNPHRPAILGKRSEFMLNGLQQNIVGSSRLCIVSGLPVYHINNRWLPDDN